MRKFLPLMATLLGACSQPSEQPTGNIQDTEEISAPSDAMPVSSTVNGLRATAINDLPRAASSTGIDASCFEHVLNPKTPGGRLAADRGWYVTAEISLKGRDVVSFVRRFEPGTSGVCIPDGGNVAVFERSKLRGLIYAPASASDGIGLITKVTSTRVRIWSGTPAPPIADVELGSGAKVQPISAWDTHCQDSVTVPNVYGKRIEEARRTLIRAGWRPISSNEADLSPGNDSELYASGIREVQGCSGTGYGFCNFAYEVDGGTLTLTALGGDPVIEYDVKCSPS